MSNFKENFRIFGLIFVSGIFLLSCSALRPLLKTASPKVKFQKLVISRLNFEGVELEAKIGILNPNAFDIPLKGLSYQLYILEEKLLAGEIPLTARIPANADTTLGLPLSFQFAELFKIARNFAAMDTIPVRLEGKINVQIPVIGVKAFPFRHSQSIPKPKKPEISLKFLKLKKLGFSGADLVLGISLKNNNPFKLLFSNFHYSLALENSDWLKGDIPNPTEISPGGSRLLEIPISLNFGQLGSGIISILKNPGNINFSLKGQTQLDTDLPYLKNLPLNFEKAGKISIQK
ncbi:MAG: hypothetical protein Kow0037_00500 [Calditrichia bacterium]